MPKAAASLGYRVGHQRDFHDPQRDNIGDKLAPQINAKESFTFFWFWSNMTFSNTMFCNLTA
jgi:hypothetical protein